MSAKGEAWQRERWESLRLRLRGSTLADKTVGALARGAQRPWLDRWQAERLRTYLACSYDELAARPGFGRFEIQRLLGILRQGVRPPPPPGRAPGLAEAALHRLNEWRIPLEHPSALIPLPSRLQRHAYFIGCSSDGVGPLLVNSVGKRRPHGCHGYS